MSLRDTQNQNKGFSMVEVMVVVAILAVIGGISFSLLNVVPQRHVSSCAESLITHVEKTRTDAMSYQDATLYIYQESDGIYVREDVTKNGSVETGERIKIGESGIKVSFKDSALEHSLGDGHYLQLLFDHSTGGFEDRYNFTDDSGLLDVGQACSGITVSVEDYEIDLKLSKQTGKISYD